MGELAVRAVRWPCDTPARRSLVSEPREGTAEAVGNPHRAAQREDMDSLQNMSSRSSGRGGSRSHPNSPAGSAAFGEKVIPGRPHLAGAHPHGRLPPAAHPAGSARSRVGPRGAARASRRRDTRGGGGTASRPALGCPGKTGPSGPCAGPLAPRPRVPGSRRSRRPLASLPAFFPPVSGFLSYLELLPGGCGWGTPPASGMRTWTRRPPFSTPRRRS